MQIVSEAYKRAMHEPIQRHRVRGTIDGVTFNEGHIVAGTFSINNKCVNSDAIGLGAAYIGEMRATFDYSLDIPRNGWNGAEIKPLFYLCTDELNDHWEAVNLGVFTVAECTRTINGFEVVAYDNMVKLDKPIETSQFNGNIYAIATYICQRCGVYWGLSQAETSALINGGELLGFYEENDVITYRDVIGYLAAVAGGFATTDRRGNIIIKSFNRLILDTFNYKERYEGANFSNYIAKFSGFYIYDKTNETNILIGNDQHNVLDLGANPFLQYGTPEVLQQQRENILQALNNIEFTPFNSDFIGNPVFELGDVIKFTDGLADNDICCIMAFDWQLNGVFNCQGYGANVDMENSAEAGGGSSSSDSGNAIRFFTWENIQQITADSPNTPVKLVTIKYGNSKLNTVEMWAEINLNLAIDPNFMNGQIVVQYYIDGELQSYTPTQIYNVNGQHILTLNKYITFEETNLHSLEIWLTGINCRFYIPAQTAHGLLKGQGLTEVDEFDGLLQFGDKLTELFKVELSTVNFNDLFDVKIQNPQSTILTDDLEQIYKMHLAAVNIADDEEPAVKLNTVAYVYVCGDQFYCDDDFII